MRSDGPDGRIIQRFAPGTSRDMSDGPGRAGPRRGHMRGNDQDRATLPRTTGAAAGQGHSIRLSIVVPAYNEEDAILAGSLKEIASWKQAQAFPVEIIVVDDGSI